MKNINMRNLIIVFVLSIISMLVGLSNVYADSTVLYEDGTLIINEKDEDRDSNIEAHGSVSKIYEPLSDNQKYEFDENNLPLWYPQRSSIKKVEIGQKISPTSTAYWFNGLANMTIGEFANLDTFKVVDMNHMFYGAGENATSFAIDVTLFDTSQVTNMSYMFYNLGLGNLKKWSIGDLTNWDTSKVADMSYMFYSDAYEIIDWNIGNLSNWDVSNVTNMSFMFAGTGMNSKTWNIGDLSNWDVSNVTNMKSMFESSGGGVANWDIGDLSNWDVSNVTDMKSMFLGAGLNTKNFNLGDLTNWDTSSVTNMRGMFSGIGTFATTWNIGNISSWDTSQVTDMSYMFYEAGNNVAEFTLNLENWDVSNVTNMQEMFAFSGNNSTIYNLNLSNWNLSKVINLEGIFDQTGHNATTFILNLSSWNVGENSLSRIFENIAPSAIKFTLDLTNWNTSQVNNMSYMLYKAGYNATTWSIGNLSNWDTSNVTNMSYMFYQSGYNATTWSIGNLSNWDTTNVTNMSYMFYESGHNTTTWSIGELSNWNTTNVTNMSYMFYQSGYYSKIFNLDLSKWNTSKVTNMKAMLLGAGGSAKTWDIGNLSNWDTSKVTNMNCLFYDVGGLSSIWSIGNLSSWDTSKVTNMNGMFEYAGSNVVEFEIDLSNWDVSNVTEMGSMFKGAGLNAKTWSIGNLSNWDTSNVTSMAYMFNDAGKNAVTFNSIGTLKMPSKCYVVNFTFGSSKFVGNFLIPDNLSSYDVVWSEWSEYGIFYKAASNSSAKINLYYEDSESKTIADRIVELYGTKGKYSRGNIFVGTYKISLTNDNVELLNDSNIKIDESAYLNTVKIALREPEFYDLKNIVIYKFDNKNITSIVKYDDNTNTFIMPNYDIRIESTIEQKLDVYDISYITSDNGKIVVPEKSYKDKIVTLQVNPDDKYRLKSIIIYDENNIDITENVNYDNNTNTFVMPEYDITIKAVFEEDSYSITKHEDIKNGVVEVEDSAIVEDNVKIKATPDKNYRLSEIAILKTSDMSEVTNEVSYNSETQTFVMPSYDVTINAKFLPIEYNISTVTSTGGVIKIYDKATYGSKVNFSFDLNAGYLLKDIKVLNASTDENVSSLVGLDKKNYTFIMPHYDVKINATFVKRPSAPKTVTAKLYGHDDVKFSWNKVTGADGYLVYYKKSTSKSYTLLLATTATSIKKANLTDGVKYYFKVVPYVKDINGIKRYNTFKVSSIYTLKQLNTPIVSKYSKNYVKIKWNNINGESGYQIARKKYGTSTYYIVKTVSYKYSSTTLKTTRGKTYYYKVRAYKTVDGKKIYGPWSYVKSYKLK